MAEVRDDKAGFNLLWVSQCWRTSHSVAVEYINIKISLKNVIMLTNNHFQGETLQSIFLLKTEGRWLLVKCLALPQQAPAQNKQLNIWSIKKNSKMTVSKELASFDILSTSALLSTFPPLRCTIVCFEPKHTKVKLIHFIRLTSISMIDINEGNGT